MSYSILISATTNNADVIQQHLLIEHNGKKTIWSRETNGGRGEVNAWSLQDYADITTRNSANFIIGEVLSSPLTEVDIDAVENNYKPNVLIQKLSKQYGLRHKEVSTQTLGEVMTEVTALIDSDSQQLEKYRSDGRSDKQATTPKKSDPQVVEPIIEIVRQQPITTSQEVIGNYVIHIPTKDEVGNYIPRVFDGITEKKFWDYAINHKANVLLEGGAGTGKTSSPLHDSYLRQQGCVLVGCSVGLEVSHLLGKVVIDPTSGKPTWVDGVLTQAMKNGDRIIFDEVDFAHPKVLQRIQDVAQNRKLTLIENGGEVVVAHPHFSLVATYNNGYRHSNKLNEAFLDRFTKVRFDYDNDIEKQIIKSTTLLQLANQMRADSISGLYSTPISLRILNRFQQQAQELNFEFASTSFVMNFTDEERSSVKLLLEAHRTQLEQELSN
jgi:nitric oxide reductase NorQ protein